MQDKLGLVEFSQVFLENLDTFVISSNVHYEENKSFYDDVIFKSFDVYQRSDIHSIRDIVNLFHCFLYAMFKNKPSVEKNDDEIIVTI